MLGLMPPGATRGYAPGSGPKGSTPLGIRYGGRGHWPGSGHHTEIPVESLYGGPSRPLADGRQSHPPPLPLGERSGQWDSPASAGLPCIRSAKPPRV